MSSIENARRVKLFLAFRGRSCGNSVLYDSQAHNQVLSSSILVTELSINRVPLFSPKPKLITCINKHVRPISVDSSNMMRRRPSFIKVIKNPGLLSYKTDFEKEEVNRSFTLQNGTDKKHALLKSLLIDKLQAKGGSFPANEEVHRSINLDQNIILDGKELSYHEKGKKFSRKETLEKQIESTLKTKLTSSIISYDIMHDIMNIKAKVPIIMNFQKNGGLGVLRNDQRDKPILKKISTNRSLSESAHIGSNLFQPGLNPNEVNTNSPNTEKKKVRFCRNVMINIYYESRKKISTNNKKVGLETR